MAPLSIQQQRAVIESELFKPRQTHWSFAQLGDVYQDCKRAYEKTPKNDWVLVEQKNPEGFQNPRDNTIISRTTSRMTLAANTDVIPIHVFSKRLSSAVWTYNFGYVRNHTKHIQQNLNLRNYKLSKCL